MIMPSMPDSAAIAKEFDEEIRARLADPPHPQSEAAALRATAAEHLRRAVSEARSVLNAMAAPLDLARVPGPLRPFARIFYRATRIAILPYLSRQRDFNHHVLDALDGIVDRIDSIGANN